MKATKIMVIEDESIVALHIQEILEDCGYTVTSTHSTGSRAIKMARLEKPDLVLVDIVLKGKIDGITAAQRIHSENGIPVIFLTAYSDPNTLKRAQAADPFGYLNKPFKPSDLHTSIQMALSKHQKEKARQEQILWSREVWESFQVPILFVDAGDTVERVTPTVSTLLNVPAEQLIGRNWQELLPLYDEMERPLNLSLKRIGKSEEPEKIHAVLKSEEGEGRQVELLVSPVRNREKQLRGAVILIHDISEYTMTPDEKRKMLEDLCFGLESGLVPNSGEILAHYLKKP